MKSIGGLMLFFGAGSMVLSLLQREFVLLAWIDTWGPTVGWVIRIALVVVGCVLWLLGNRAEARAAE